MEVGHAKEEAKRFRQQLTDLRAKLGDLEARVSTTCFQIQTCCVIRRFVFTCETHANINCVTDDLPHATLLAQANVSHYKDSSVLLPRTQSSVDL